ncbi:filamentous hemagglutinin N-terminal domain-containing protein [Parahaliea mediterranea]|uniref:two-partner secretion domain-containing protein n=1 Tax=Parahaliea mediterranea TaxID=651086 RepID=UPI0013009DAD|nr:filamentous hemagglutinin N-terminal domain-containing protein [Parahaliea mediterranea]
MAERKPLGAALPGQRLMLRRAGLGRLLPLLAAAWAHSAWPDAVFDGSIGPNAAGTLRGGQFEIREGDGAVAGNNLFHSFSAFGVGRDEVATFSHQSANINHIIARVSGNTATEIYGGMQVRQDLGSSLVPTAAALWLINPNGIVVGDGALFDTQSTFVLSTANRLGFANGESFYSHEPVLSSVLSVAEPSAFGFLDRQDLPAGVTARGITVAIADPDNTNIPVLLPNLTLVGTSLDPATPALQLSGDIGPAFSASAGLAPEEGTSLRANSLGLGALAAGGVMQVDAAMPHVLSAEAGAALGGIRIDGIPLDVSDFGFAERVGLTLLADSVEMSNTYINAVSATQTVPITLRATSGTALRNTLLQSGASGELAGGDIRIDSQQVMLSDSIVLSQGSASAPGNILLGTSASLPLQRFSLSDSQLQSFSFGAAPAGDILLNVQDELLLTGQPGVVSGISSINSAGGAAGDILLRANRIYGDGVQMLSAGVHPGDERFIGLQAGAGGLELRNSSLTGLIGQGRSGASILLDAAGDITLAADGDGVSRLATGTSNAFNGGNIFVTAQGDLNLRGSLEINSSSDSDIAATGAAGTIALTGRNIRMSDIADGALRGSISSFTSSSGDSGNIVLSAAQDLLISAPYDLASNTLGAGNSGAIILQAGRIAIDSPLSTSVSTASVDTGQAGIISMAALDSLELSNVFASSLASDQGAAAGFILLDGANVQVQDSVLSTSTLSLDPSDTPAQISVSASTELNLRDSTLQSNSVGLAPAGQVLLTAGEQLRVENVSMQSATTDAGITGSILLISGGDIALSGVGTELLSNALGSSDAGDVSLVAEGSLLLEDRAVIQTISAGSGDAGTILLRADEVRIDRAKVEGTSENGGGGDVNIFGRDIQIDGEPSVEGIVVITADSQSSDAAGNGGSITLGDPLAPAELVLVRYSALLASANAGNGGRININADNFLRDALSTFQVTSTLGDAGSLEINAPEQDISAAVAELDVALLDATNLIQDRCAINPEDASSLVVRGEGAMAERYDDYLTSGMSTAGEAAGAPPGARAWPGASAPTGHSMIALRQEAPCNVRN